MSTNPYVASSEADDAVLLESQLSVGKVTNVSPSDEPQHVIEYVPVSGGDTEVASMSVGMIGDVSVPGTSEDIYVLLADIGGARPVVLDTLYTPDNDVPSYEQGERIFGHDATDSYIKYDADGNIILCPEAELQDCDGNTIGGVVAVSDDGTQVLASASDLNFGSNVSVTDDGDGTVTIDASSSGSSEPTLFTVEREGTLSNLETAELTVREVPNKDELAIHRATLIGESVTAAPSGVSMRIVTADGVGSLTDQVTVLSGDGSTVYVDESGDPYARYTNDSGSSQYVALYIDNGTFGSGTGSTENLFAEADVAITDATFLCIVTHLQGDFAFSGGATLSDDRVIFAPHGSNNVGIYNPSTDTYSDGAAHGEGSTAFSGATVLSDDRVVFAPRGSSNVGIYDPSSDTYTSGPAHGEGVDAFRGATTLSDDRVVFAPYESSNVGIYDPSSNTYTGGAAHGEGGFAFIGAATLNDDRVVLGPHNSSNVGIYDPSSDTYTSGPAHGQSFAGFGGATTLSDNRVVFAPYNSNNVGVYDPSSNTYTSGPAHGEGGSAFVGSTTLSDDRVVFAPFDSSNVGIYDPSSDTYTSGPAHGTVINAFAGAALLSTDTVVFVSHDADCIGEYNP